jgi:hypothetical protein
MQKWAFEFFDLAVFFKSRVLWIGDVKELEAFL